MTTIIIIIDLLLKKPIDADYSALTDENESSHKVPKFKIDDRVRITKNKNIFSIGCTKTWSGKIFCSKN